MVEQIDEFAADATNFSIEPDMGESEATSK